MVLKAFGSLRGGSGWRGGQGPGIFGGDLLSERV